MKREPAEPQGFIKPTGVGIPRLQAGEEVKKYEYPDLGYSVDRGSIGAFQPESRMHRRMHF